MANKLLCLFLILCALHVNGQEYSKKTDSLYALLPRLQQDTTRVNILNRISYYVNDAHEKIRISTEALNLAQRLKYSKGIIESYVNMAGGYQYLTRLDEEFKYLEKALAESKRSKNYSKTAEVYTWMGLNKNISDFNLSLKYFKEAIKVAEQAKDHKVLNDVLLQLGGVYQAKGKLYEAADCFRKVMINGDRNNDVSAVINGSTYLAGIYKAQNNFDKALEYNLKAFALLKKQNNYSVFTCYLMMDIGKLYYEKLQYKKALNYYNTSYSYVKKLDNPYAQAMNLIAISNTYKKLKSNKQAQAELDKAFAVCSSMKPSYSKLQVLRELGETQFSTQNYEQALALHNEALEFCKQTNLYEDIAIQNGNVGATYYMLAKEAGKAKADLYVEKSIKHLREAVAVLKKMENFNNLQLYSYYLSEVYEFAGKSHLALPAYKEAVAYRDSLFNKEKRDAFTLAQSEYEYGKKEAVLKEQQKAEVLHQKTMRNVSLAGVCVLVVVAAGAGYGYVNKRKDNKVIAQEKKRSDDLLLNILPQEVAEELKEKGEANAQYYEQVSILFTDFEGFTQLAEKMSPKELLYELNYCFKTFDQIITKYNIEKIKTIGDAYMAVSGLPSSSPDHAINVVRAAIEIRDFILNYQEERKREGKVYFKIRIGINSGEVVAGIVGIKKFAYDIWGDAVNIAARMESNGVVGKVNVSEATYQLIKNDFDTEFRGQITAKGKGDVNMYFVEPKKENNNAI